MCVRSDEARMPTRSRIPDEVEKNADAEDDEDEDEENGDETSDQWDDDDDCLIIEKKVMEKVADVEVGVEMPVAEGKEAVEVPVAAAGMDVPVGEGKEDVEAKDAVRVLRNIAEDVMMVAINVMMRERAAGGEGQDVVVNGGDGAVGGEGEDVVVNRGDSEIAVPPEHLVVEPPVGDAPQEVMNGDNDDMKGGCDDGNEVRPIECLVERALEKVKGGPMVDIYMHVAEVKALMDDHEDVVWGVENGKSKLVHMKSVMSQHMMDMKHSSNMMRAKMDSMGMENEELGNYDEDAIYAAKKLLEADLCVAERHRKTMECAMILVGDALAAQKEMVERVYNMSSDMKALDNLLHASRAKAHGFSQDMKRLQWKKWNKMLGKATMREYQRAEERFQAKQDRVEGREMKADHRKRQRLD